MGSRARAGVVLVLRWGLQALFGERCFGPVEYDSATCCHQHKDTLSYAYMCLDICAYMLVDAYIYKVLYFYECICICPDDAMYIDMRLHTYMVSMDVSTRL